MTNTINIIKTNVIEITTTNFIDIPMTNILLSVPQLDKLWYQEFPLGTIATLISAGLMLLSVQEMKNQNKLIHIAKVWEFVEKYFNADIISLKNELQPYQKPNTIPPYKFSDKDLRDGIDLVCKFNHEHDSFFIKIENLLEYDKEKQDVLVLILDSKNKGIELLKELNKLLIVKQQNDIHHDLYIQEVFNTVIHEILNLLDVINNITYIKNGQLLKGIKTKTEEMQKYFDEKLQDKSLSAESLQAKYLPKYNRE